MQFLTILIQNSMLWDQLAGRRCPLFASKCHEEIWRWQQCLPSLSRSRLRHCHPLALESSAGLDHHLVWNQRMPIPQIWILCPEIWNLRCRLGWGLVVDPIEEVASLLLSVEGRSQSLQNLVWIQHHLHYIRVKVGLSWKGHVDIRVLFKTRFFDICKWLYPYIQVPLGKG